MKSLNIAFDKDGVLTWLGWLPAGKGNGRQTILDAKPSITYQNRPLIRKALCTGMKLYTRYYPYRQDMIELMKRLAEEGHKIYIITRAAFGTEDSIEGRDVRHEVYMSLAKAGIPCEMVIFVEGNKVTECQEYDIDYIIEDNAETITSLREAGIKTIRVMTKYNNNLDGDDEYAASNTNDIYNIINSHELEEEKSITNLHLSRQI